MVTTGLSLLSHVSQVLATNLSEANSNPLKKGHQGGVLV